jgi:hypothetical protein
MTAIAVEDPPSTEVGGTARLSPEELEELLDGIWEMLAADPTLGGLSINSAAQAPLTVGAMDRD